MPTRSALMRSSAGSSSVVHGPYLELAPNSGKSIITIAEKHMVEVLQHQQMVRIRIEAVSLDSTIVKVHPDGTGALKKTALKPSGNPEVDGAPKFIWLPRMLAAPSRSG